MQVIADLHGGDLEDVSAKAEFQEIKDRVSIDVSVFNPATAVVRRSLPPVASIWRGTLLQGYVGKV